MPHPTSSQRFGRYETLFRIAGGGMAEVYAARQLGEGGFQKLVALKRMRPELAEDARFVTMFLDEGRVAANIQSPNVVATLDLGRAEDNSLYLVMELVNGVSLQAILDEIEQKHGRIPVPIGVDIIAQASAGLHDAHEAKSPTGEPLEIVHRDCSPHNILVDVQGVVKITDFGIAKAMERQTRSHAGEMKGKLSYLSPEQARGRPVDRRCDTFILGIVAWEVFANTQLFESDNPVEALHKIVTMPIPNLVEMNSEVTPEIANVVARALDRDPDKRFTTTAAFGDALLDALGDRVPPRTALGEFVRRSGGTALRDVETGIRDALGRKLSEAPRPFESAAIPHTHFQPSDSSKTGPLPPQGKSRSSGDTLPIPAEHRGNALPSSHPALAASSIANDAEFGATMPTVDPDVIRAIEDAARANAPARKTLALGGETKPPRFSGGAPVHGRHAFPNTQKSDEPVAAPSPLPIAKKPNMVLRGLLVAAMILVIGGSAVAGVYLADDDIEPPTSATGATPIEAEAVPIPPDDSVTPVRVEVPPIEDEISPIDGIEASPVPPARVRVRRHPPVAHTATPTRREPVVLPGNRTPPTVIHDRTNAPRGDREVALDEIPWDD